MLKKIVISIIFVLVSTSNLWATDADSTFTWPREIDTKKGNITLYQPQYEKYESNILEGRMAVSIKVEEKDLLFGAVWFKARLSTDNEARSVVLEKMEIIRVNFPDVEDQVKIDEFTSFLSKEIESWDVIMSLDRFIAGMSEIEDQRDLSVKLDNTPPDIYFRTSPSVLISIDGEPKLKTDENTKLQYVQNTPFFIVTDSKKQNYYIKNGKFWYSSNEITKSWKETNDVPSKIKEFAKNSNQEELDSLALSITEAPALIVVTKPSELVSTDGEPDYATIEGTSLLFASNTEDDIIMDINSQQHYILIAGRWYHSKTLKDGDWKFAEPNNLPAEFEKIPEDSKMASVRVSIPNTPEAKDALLEQSIPQTATINRKEATVEVSYDGDPKFEKIEGTEMSYAVNTNKTVILISNKYYCVDNAVWFVSDKATGPWEVSVVRPDEVDNIPPESPVYNVKYVYIYESTPEVVYVGYLPGYNYSYVYGGVVVYGTGYYYNPWYGPYYYPRPVTYGYGVHYNPYTGWGFSFGISVGWGFHPYGPWGPRGYHHGYRRGYNHGYHRGYNHGYNRGYSQGAKAGYRAGQRSGNSNNVYNNRNNGVKNTGNRQGTLSGNKAQPKSRPSTKQNNMYADKKGNVYQQDKKGDFNKKSNSNSGQNSTRANSQTKPKSNTGTRNNQSTPKTTQQQKPNNNNRQLNQSSQNRSRGTQNYNRSRNSGYSGGARSGGGARPSGGGGRRR